MGQYTMLYVVYNIFLISIRNSVSNGATIKSVVNIRYLHIPIILCVVGG